MKEEAVKILKNKDYMDLYTISIGKVMAQQLRFIDYLGEFSKWNCDFTKGEIILDDEPFDAQFIGSSSIHDNSWFSAEVESVIPDEYVELIMQTRNRLRKLGLEDFYYEKIELDDYITADSLAVIYTAFAPENVCYFKGSSDDGLTLYAYIKQLPETIYEKIGSNEFISVVMRIIENFSLNHRLLIESFLINNDCELTRDGDTTIGAFGGDSNIKFEFDEYGRLLKYSGTLN